MTVAESPLSQEPSAKDDLLIQALEESESQANEEQQISHGSKADTVPSAASNAGSTPATATGSASPSAQLDPPNPVAKKNPFLALRDLVMSSRRNMIIAAVSTVLLLLILITAVVAIVLLTAEEPAPVEPEVPELDMTPRGVAGRWYEETFGDAKLKAYFWTFSSSLGLAVLLLVLLSWNSYTFSDSQKIMYQQISVVLTCGITVAFFLIAGLSYLTSLVSGAYVSTWIVSLELMFGGKLAMAGALGVNSVLFLLVVGSVATSIFLFFMTFLERKLKKRENWNNEEVRKEYYWDSWLVYLQKPETFKKIYMTIFFLGVPVLTYLWYSSLA